MGKSLSDLGLKNPTEQIEVDYDNVPEEWGGPSAPPPYPDDYAFKLPPKLTSAWDSFVSNDKEYVSLVFDDDNPLTIIQTKRPEYQDVEVKVRVNNMPRKRGKEGPLVSDGTYLLRVLDPNAKPKNNKEFITEMNKHGGKEFVAGLVWGTNCGEKRDAYFEVQDAETGSVRLEKKQIEGSEGFQQGCGNRYYMNQWPKVDGKYTDRLTCECGASLRPFPALERFRARTK